LNKKRIEVSFKTTNQYDQQLKKCREIYLKKTKDYGTAWRILRPSSLTDQLYIKAKRIRSIEEKGEQKIDEGVENEFIGLVNYSIMALIQLDLGDDAEIELSETAASDLYDNYSGKTRDLMIAKNHDYGEAWREMRISSLTDLILMKLLRIKQIEDNKGKTLISEGLDAGYQDIINYALFALIRLDENNVKTI
jgi:hypothetical protein